MRVRVKFVGFPELKRRLGTDRADLELDGPTLGHLLAALRERLGREVERYLLDGNGGIDNSIQIIRNGREWLSREDMKQRLRDGDEITFLLMLAGG